MCIRDRFLHPQALVALLRRAHPPIPAMPMCCFSAKPPGEPDGGSAAERIWMVVPYHPGLNAAGLQSVIDGHLRSPSWKRALTCVLHAPLKFKSLGRWVAGI